MRRLIVLIVALLALPLVVSAREKRFGYCQTQSVGTRVKTCTVEVFLTGTLTHPPQIYQDNIGTPLSNPFIASSTTGLWAFYADNGHYDVKLSGGVPTISPAYTLSDYLLLDLFDVTTTLSAQHFDSTSANISTAGFLRMASSDLIEWRNSANTGDLALGVVGATGNRPADTLLYPVGMEATFFMSNGVDTSVALGGTLRLHAGDSINWRNSANTNDFVLAKAVAQGNMPETVFVQNQASPGTEGFSAGAFIQNGSAATVAASGALRLHAGDTINWRNNANTDDMRLFRTGVNGNVPADTLAYVVNTGGAIAGIWGSPVIASSGTLPSVTGDIRLSSSGTINWRNNANSADVSISKNTSDNLVYPNSLVLGGALSTTRVNFTGSAPSCTFLTGGGTSPSCAINSNYSDQAGVLSLQTGTGSPGSSGTFSITYSAPFSTVSSCVLMLDNVLGNNWNARATLFGGGFNASGSGTITWDNNGVPLGVSTSYTVHYICGGK